VWTGINGVLAVGSFALLPFVERDQRIELVVGGAGSTVASLFTWFVPLDIEAALARKVQPAILCQRLVVEEQFMTAAASDEVSRVTWPWHLVNLGFAVSYTLIVGFGTDRWPNGILDGVVALAVGEAQLFTQPTRLGDQWEAYRRNPGITPKAWSVAALPQRGGISATFRIAF